MGVCVHFHSPTSGTRLHPIGRHNITKPHFLLYIDMTGRGRPRTAKTPSGTVADSPTVQNDTKLAPVTKDCKENAEEKQQSAEKEKRKKREEKQQSAERETPKREEKQQSAENEKRKKSEEKQQNAERETPKKREEKPQSAENEKRKKREEKQQSAEKETPKEREERQQKGSRDRVVGGKPPRAEGEKPKSREQKQLYSSAQKPGISRVKSEEGKPPKPKRVADGGRSKSLGCSIAEEIADKEPRTRIANAKCPMPETKKDDRDQILIMTLDKLKIKKEERAEAARIINSTVKSIKDHLKMTKCFKDVKDLPTGSYYENLKINNPDEFDVMMTISAPRIEVQPIDKDGAFYTASFKRGSHPLKDVFQLEDNIIPASEILTEFRKEVTESVKSLQNITLDRKKKGCPAVTLSITVQGQDPISLDVVFGLEVTTSWPPFTKEGLKIERWLGTKVKQEFKREPYYLVPKYEGVGTKERDGGLAKDGWRISFSHVEKKIMKNHGSEKTCCEARGTSCCRKGCLKLLKHLLGLLKEKYATLSDFCSYHVKTTFFHACSSRPKDSEWDYSRLGHCFQQLLVDFERSLREGTLPNFFIPTQNLLSGLSKKSCKTLLKHLEEERTNGFPIFC